MVGPATMPIMVSKILVVVANGTQAHLLLSKEGGPLQEIGMLHHREESSPGSVGRSKHNTDAHAAPRQKTRASFAVAVADHLKEVHNGGTFERLYLVAGPAFLGDLRQSLSGPVAALLVGEVDKDLTAHNPAKIREYLPPVL